MASKYIPEMLEEINNNIASLPLYKDDAVLAYLFKYAYDPEHKFILPEGEPPFKPDDAPIGMSPAILKQELRRLYVFCRKDLTPLRRETLFINLLESIHPSEAKVILAVKDGDFSKLYKNITHEAVYKAGLTTIQPPVVKGKPIKEKISQPTVSTTGEDTQPKRRGRPAKKKIGTDS